MSAAEAQGSSQPHDEPTFVVGTTLCFSVCSLGLVSAVRRAQGGASWHSALIAEQRAGQYSRQGFDQCADHVMIRASGPAVQLCGCLQEEVGAVVITMNDNKLWRGGTRCVHCVWEHAWARPFLLALVLTCVGLSAMPRQRVPSPCCACTVTVCNGGLAFSTTRGQECSAAPAIGVAEHSRRSASLQTTAVQRTGLSVCG